MLITFHIPVLVDALIGKLTKPRHLIGTYPVEVDIPVVSNSAAPKVARFVASDGNGFRKEVVLRHFLGRFHEQLDLEMQTEKVCDSWSEEGSSDLFSRPLSMISKRVTELEAQGIDTARENVYPVSNKHFLFNKHWRRSSALEPIESYGVRGDLHLETLAEYVEAFRSEMADICIVDGYFIRPCPEPVIRAKPFYGAVSLGVEREMQERASIPLSDNAKLGQSVNAYAYFRLTDLERAQAFPKSIGAYDSYRMDDLGLEIFDETAFVAPVEEHALVDLARVMRKRFVSLFSDDPESETAALSKVEDFMDSVDLGSLKLFKQLSTAIHQYSTDGDVGLVEECVSSVVETNADHPFRHNFIGWGMEDQVGIVWDYWNSRDVSMATANKTIASFKGN